MLSHGSCTARRAAPRPSSHIDRHATGTPPRSASSGARPPRRDGFPAESAVELARWGFGQLAATVADFPEESEAVMRVAAAVERALRGTDPDALDKLDEADVLTTASILITTVDPHPQLVDAIAVALDALLYGDQLELARGRHGACCRGGMRRAPRTVGHLFLIP